jgi:hypothetical protein
LSSSSWRSFRDAVPAGSTSADAVYKPAVAGQAAGKGKQRSARAEKKRAKKAVSQPKAAEKEEAVAKEATEPAALDDIAAWTLDPDPIVSAPPLVDEAKVLRTLRLLLPPGQVTEVRILDGTFVGDRTWSATLSGYFDDPVAVVSALGKIESATGVYIITNSVEPALLARAANRIKRAPKGESTSDNNIVARLWLPVDCDAVRPSGISANDAQHEAALARAMDVNHYLIERGWPEPIIADSGNGGHLLYPINLPVDDGGIVKRCLCALDARFTDNVVKIDTSVFNPARIWKLYGTAACKGDHTPDRPHRMSRIISAPGET